MSEIDPGPQEGRATPGKGRMDQSSGGIGRPREGRETIGDLPSLKRDPGRAQDAWDGKREGPERRKGRTKVKGRKAKGRGTTTENGTAEMIEPGARNEREEGATRVLSKCEG